MNFNDVILARRSIRKLKKTDNFDSKKIVQLIENSLEHTPTGFNMTAGRTVVLFGKENEKLWDEILDILTGVMKPEGVAATQKKLAGFKGGDGTVLFFEDQDKVDKLKEQMPKYADPMQEWSIIGQGMLEYIVWAALSDEGYGASLQHYNPLIDEMIQKNWGVPKGWKLYAQMPFGAADEVPVQKPKVDISSRIMIFE